MIAVTKTLGATLLALSLASVAQAGPARQCADESEKLVGQKAAVIGSQGRPPRKLHADPLDLAAGAAKVGSGIWLGEALIDGKGKVQAVWTMRSPTFQPAWPEFDEIVAKNIRDWVYEPAVVDGTPTPVCIVVSVLINYSK